MSSLNYSDFEPLNSEISNNENKNKIQRKSRNQTLKNRKRENTKVKDFIQAIENDDNLYEFNPGDSNNQGSSLSNQSMPPNPTNTQYKDFSQPMYSNSMNDDRQSQDNEGSDEEVTRENFNNLNSNYSDEYYKQFVPYYNQVSNNQELSGNKDVLLEKLNYMIHLLEEQQEEKTGHITEELILYCFLGVFVIFVVDSFARAGKYVR